MLAPNDPNVTNLALKNAPPSAEYPLGCDQMGRCELSRLLYGARYYMGLTIPVLIVLAAFALFVGCYSSYKGGLLDEVTVSYTHLDVYKRQKIIFDNEYSLFHKATSMLFYYTR